MCTKSGRLEDNEEECERANDYDDENDDEAEEEDEGENQVVAWSSKTPPPAASSSSSDFSSVSGSSASAVKNRGIDSSLKRIRDQVDLGLYLSDQKLSSIDSLPAERSIYVNRFNKKQRQGIWREESRAIDLNLPASPSR
jgi:hypothetical protein